MQTREGNRREGNLREIVIYTGEETGFSDTKSESSSEESSATMGECGYGAGGASQLTRNC